MSRSKMEFADIPHEHVEKIKELEKELGDVCLLAVKKAESIYVLEAKVSPNRWESVHKVYPKIETLRSYYDNLENAKAAKVALKNLLKSKKYEFVKRPIRLRKLTDNT
nr:hypothetical protein [Desulfobacterales bacterium]